MAGVRTLAFASAAWHSVTPLFLHLFAVQPPPAGLSLGTGVAPGQAPNPGLRDGTGKCLPPHRLFEG